jgi:hypothetical protein
VLSRAKRAKRGSWQYRRAPVLDARRARLQLELGVLLTQRTIAGSRSKVGRRRTRVARPDGGQKQKIGRQ